ncbi:hypothetical protein CPB83DRAFT_443131 [Crepidotus variabilis]|uniref:Uncharacterized protein n=1 Tax=Crepidotus variabilis TaxID=179855 RepID=A0A9P6JN76_9AGAR|nr:hypothetical protein CPB83DRAFT_443131 [Crepidotus variabilis]
MKGLARYRSPFSLFLHASCGILHGETEKFPSFSDCLPCGIREVDVAKFWSKEFVDIKHGLEQDRTTGFISMQ